MHLLVIMMKASLSICLMRDGIDIDRSVLQVFGLWVLLFFAAGAALLFVACQEAVHHVMQAKTRDDERQCSSEVGNISAAEKGSAESTPSSI